MGRLGQERQAQRLLEESVQDATTEPWKRRLLSAQLGQLTMAELVEGASNQSQICEARFYSGYRSIIEGNEAVAIRAFRQVESASCFRDYEFLAARIVLHQLGETSGP